MEQLMKVNAVNDKGINATVDVLIIDDQLIDLKLLSNYLNEYDISFRIEDNAVNAIKILAEYTFKLILIDIEILENNINHIIKEIRSDLHSDVPIVAIIGNDLEASEKKCFGFGVNGCFSRPISKIELVGVLTQFLPEEILSTSDIRTVDEPVQYQAIDLSYLKELSMGDKAYEREITGKFIELISDEINELYNCLATGHDEKLKRTAHKMLSTIYVMGLGPKLSAHLRAIEFDNLTKDQLKDRIALVAIICEKAKEEAQVFLEQ